ncbi:MAG: copper chaperone PCu(A)C [Burkholderiales bacterium]
MKRVILGVLLSGAVALAQGQVEVRAPWVRGTVQGQTSSGAFMELKSATGAAVVGVETPVAEIVEMHETKMDGDVMKMRAVPRIELPAGRTVELKPGGYHVMLMSLKRPLKKGDIVPIRLRIEGKDKSVKTVEVRAEVRDLTASGMPGMH